MNEKRTFANSGTGAGVGPGAAPRSPTGPKTAPRGDDTAAPVGTVFERRPIVPEIGERSLIVGQTGSGKTAFSTWLLKRSKSAPTILYDTKNEEKFRLLPRSVYVHSWEGVLKRVADEDIDYIVLQPPHEVISDPTLLDGYLLRHYEDVPLSEAYVDEIYTFHRGSKAGPGLIALLTRGRSRGITTTISTQRPAWISRFCLTEAQNFYIFTLVDKKDAQRLADVIPGFADLPPARKFHFYYYRSGEDRARLYAPVKLDRGMDTGYVSYDANATRTWL